MDATDAEVDIRREIQPEETEKGKAKVKREELEAEEEDVEEDKKRRVSIFSSALGKKGGIGGNNARYCQAEKCLADMNGARQYHRKHKVCEHHAKAQVVLVCGIRQRFCQQCSRFHEISEFDETKRSCRRRLAGHNDRRRKISADSSSNRDCSRVEELNDKILSDQIS